MMFFGKFRLHTPAGGTSVGFFKVGGGVGLTRCHTVSHSSTYHVLMSSSTLCFTKNDNMVNADVGSIKWNLYVQLSRTENGENGLCRANSSDSCVHRFVS